LMSQLVRLHTEVTAETASAYTSMGKIECRTP
jgi:hypothetical protein